MLPLLPLRCVRKHNVTSLHERPAQMDPPTLPVLQLGGEKRIAGLSCGTQSLNRPRVNLGDGVNERPRHAHTGRGIDVTATSTRRST